MTKVKMLPCCARRVAKLRGDEAHLRRLAYRAARNPDHPKWPGLIKAAKAVVADARAMVIEHEGEHADAA